MNVLALPPEDGVNLLCFRVRAILLIISGIESNPGPETKVVINEAALDLFANKANKNTRQGKETLGLLVGTKVNNCLLFRFFE